MDWTWHFLASYATANSACADASLGSLRTPRRKFWYPYETQNLLSRSQRYHAPAVISAWSPAPKFIRPIAITPTGPCPWGIGIIIWRDFKLLGVYPGTLYALKLVNTHTDGCRNTCRQRENGMHRFYYSHVIRSFYLVSLSPFCRIIVPVNRHSRHNPKQSSKVSSQPACNCLEV